MKRIINNQEDEDESGSPFLRRIICSKSIRNSDGINGLNINTSHTKTIEERSDTSPERVRDLLSDRHFDDPSCNLMAFIKTNGPHDETSGSS